MDLLCVSINAALQMFPVCGKFALARVLALERSNDGNLVFNPNTYNLLLLSTYCYYQPLVKLWFPLTIY